MDRRAIWDDAVKPLAGTTVDKKLVLLDIHGERLVSHVSPLPTLSRKWGGYKHIRADVLSVYCTFRVFSTTFMECSNCLSAPLFTDQLLKLLRRIFVPNIRERIAANASHFT